MAVDTAMNDALASEHDPSCVIGTQYMRHLLLLISGVCFLKMVAR